jgi:hypothetical protein
MSAETPAGASSEQAGESSAAGEEPSFPAAQPGLTSDFSSPAPSAWSQPAPETWAHEPAMPAEPAADTWPGHAVQEPTPVGSPGPEPWPGQAGQQPTMFGPPAPEPWPGQPAQPEPSPSFGSPPDQPARLLPGAGPFGPAAGQSSSGGYAPGQVPPHEYSPGQYPPGQYSPGQGQAGQFGYQPQYVVPTATRNNPLAIAALCCGIGQFVLGLAVVGNILAAIPAIILGAIALKQIRLRGERGRGMAIAGLVLGILGVFYFLLVIGLIVVGVSTSNST